MGSAVTMITDDTFGVVLITGGMPKAMTYTSANTFQAVKAMSKTEIGAVNFREFMEPAPAIEFL